MLAADDPPQISHVDSGLAGDVDDTSSTAHEDTEESGPVSIYRHAFCALVEHEMDTALDDESEIDNSEPSGTRVFFARLSVEREKEWKVTWHGEGGQKFRAGACVIFSRTDPEVDRHPHPARIFQCDLQLHSLRLRNDWKPPCAENIGGVWRLDLVEDSRTFLRMLSSIETLCDRPADDRLQRRVVVVGK